MSVASSKHTTNSGIFSVSAKLYGRNAELENMYQSFQRVIEGGTEVLLITGHSGVGKSALIGEFEQKIEYEDLSGFVATGKCDKLEYAIPYYPLIQAFDEIVLDIINNATKFELLIWRKSIQKALGGVGRVLTQLIPRLEELIGEQPPLPIVTGREAINRFSYAFQRFISSIATKNRPLILFVDDLQWIDNASLSLIQNIVTNTTVKYFLFLGAYRENEVPPEHALNSTLKNIQNSSLEIGKRKVYHINIHNLNANEVLSLVSDSLSVEEDEVKDLAFLIYRKTLGNPFFTRQLLRKLYDDQLLAYDTFRHLWIWDIEELDTVNITENVVELMVEKLNELPESTREVLKIASCIGRRFSLEMLEIINERLQIEVYDSAFNSTFKHLRKAKAEGFIVEQGESYLFVHDRIHFAVNQLSSRLFRQKVHLHIGRLLYGQLKKRHYPLLISEIDELPTDEIFNIITHWNKASQFIDNKVEKSQLATLNYIAGSKAMQTAAFKAALKYFNQGISMLYDDSWRRDYDLTLALHSYRMEAEYLTGKMNNLADYRAYITKHVVALTDAVKAYEVSIQALSAQQQLDEAANLGIDYLKRLQLKFPKKAGKLTSLRALVRMTLLMSRRKPLKLVNLRDMTDKRALVIMRIFSVIGIPIYLGGNPFLPVYVLKGLQVTLRYGNSPYSVFAYGGYGLIASAILKRHKVGYQYGKLLSNLIDRFGATQFSTFAALVKHTFLIHPQRHLRETITPTTKAYKVGLETGSVEFTSYVAFTNAYFSFFIGTPLSEVISLMAGYIQKMEEFGQQLAVHRMRIYQQTFLNLAGKSGNTFLLKGDAYDEEAMLPKALEKNVVVIKANYLCNKMIISYLFGQYDEALRCALEGEEPTKQSARGSYMLRMYYFYSTLTYCKVLTRDYKSATNFDKNKVKKKAEVNIKLIKKWSENVHANFLHKYKLVLAESKRSENKLDEVGTLYREALLIAEKEEFTNEVALVSELAGDFYYEIQDKTKAKAHLNKAIRAYTDWEADAKVEHIQSKYNTLLNIES